MEDVEKGQTIETDVYDPQQPADNSAIFVASQGFDNGEDTEFVDVLVETLEAGLCINYDLHFATEFGYGAAMSYSLAFPRALDLRAVAAFSGRFLSGCDSGTEMLAYLGIHGISDTVSPTDGGHQLPDTFIAVNDCAAQDIPQPEQGSLTRIKIEHEGFSDGYPVTWIALDEGHLPAPHNGGTGNNGSDELSPDEAQESFSHFT